MSQSKPPAPVVLHQTRQPHTAVATPSAKPSDMTAATIEAVDFRSTSSDTASSYNRACAPAMSTPPPSLSLKELAHLREQLRDLTCRNDVLSNLNQKLSDEVNSYKSMNETLQARLKNMPALLSDFERYKTAAVSLESDLRRSFEEKDSLQQKLFECRDKLFRLQPARQVTELDVVETYLSFCSTVEEWVEQQFSDMTDLHTAITMLKESSSSNAFDLVQKRVANTGVLDMVEACPDASFYVVIHILMATVHDQLLQNRKWILAMHVDDERLLNEISEGMSRLEPLRDENTMGAWRSETLQSLLKVDRFAKMQQQQLSAFAKAMGDSGGLLGELAKAQGQKLFDQEGLETISSMAGELFKLLASASEQYVFHFFDFRPDDPKMKRLLHQADATDCTLVDVAIGQRLSNSAQIVWDEDGIGGDKLCVIFPALKKQLSDGTLKTASKGTILVKFDKPVQKKA